jgi:hypothetical protein
VEVGPRLNVKIFTPIVRNVKSELTIEPPLCMGDFGLKLLLDASTRMESIDYAIFLTIGVKILTLCRYKSIQNFVLHYNYVSTNLCKLLLPLG